MLLEIPDIIFEDWLSVQTAFDRVRFNLGTDASPTYAGLTLTGLTASRLIASDASKGLESTDIVSWIAGTTNQVVVTDDADGTVTLSTPQDTHTEAQMELAGVTIKNGSGNIIFHVNHDEMYFTECPTEPVTGNPIGLLLVLTYTV